MTKLNLLLITCCIAIFSSCSIRHDENVTKENKIIKTDSLSLEIDRLGIEFTKKNNVPGLAVAVIENGKITSIQCIGYADLATEKKITPRTIFNIGSISKVVSAWGFMQLTEKGLVKLDEPVNQSLTRWRLPQSSYDVSKVTLRRILSHTAGLSVHGYGGFEQGTKLLSLEESLNGKQKEMEKVYIL